MRAGAVVPSHALHLAGACWKLCLGSNGEEVHDGDGEDGQDEEEGRQDAVTVEDEGEAVQWYAT